jgi:hypothetical protein
VRSAPCLPHDHEEEVMLHTRRPAFAVLVLMALMSVLAPQAAVGRSDLGSQAKETAPTMIPFRGTLEGRHVSRTPLSPSVVSDRFEATGEATHLGHFEVVITATVDFGTFPVRGVGTYTFTAANGDRLVANHTGSSALLRPGTVLITEHAIVDPTRSTGRFAGATGTFTVARLADAATGVGGVTSGTILGSISSTALGRRPASASTRR